MESRLIRILGIDDVAILQRIRLEARYGSSPLPLPAAPRTGRRSQMKNGANG
jgi:hypothetical protein